MTHHIPVEASHSGSFSTHALSRRQLAAIIISIVASLFVAGVGAFVVNMVVYENRFTRLETIVEYDADRMTEMRDKISQLEANISEMRSRSNKP